MPLFIPSVNQDIARRAGSAASPAPLAHAPAVLSTQEQTGLVPQALLNPEAARRQQLHKLGISLGPSPLIPGQTGFLSVYQDKNLGLELQKLNNNAFLYKGRILRFDAKSCQYVDLQSRPIDRAKLRMAEEHDHDVLDVTQGEIGVIPHSRGGMQKIRTTGASPCVTVIVRDTNTCKTLMAHFHRYNNIDDLMKKAVDEFGEENMDMEVHLLTKAYEGERDEATRQAQIMNSLNQRFGDTFDYLVDIKQNWNAANASIDVSTGEITYPHDKEIDPDKGTIAAIRALAIETAWSHQPADNSKGFIDRTANIMAEDAQAFAETPLLNEMR